MLEDLTNNIAKLELKVKKFGKMPANEANIYGVQLSPGKGLYMSPRRKSVSPGKKDKKGSLKNSPNKNMVPQIKYPYDDVLPSMIGGSIDDFISNIAEKKAKDLTDAEVSELSEEVKHQMTMSKEMNINKVDGTFYSNVPVPYR